ncbi:MAG: CHAD domain-containing protein [Pseudomonadota bacterium]
MAPLKSGIAPSTSPDVALRHIVAKCHADLVKYRRMVLAGRRPEGIHQTRVALRRLRAAFSLFRHAIDGPVMRALSAEAKWLAGECGPARDLHVFLTEIADEVSPLVRRVARRLADSHLQRARAALSSARFDAFDRQLHAFQDLSPAHPTDRLDAFARSALKARHDKVLRRGRKLETLSVKRLHKLRIAMKKLRYAAEFLQPAFARPAVKPYIEATARLQGALGILNDRAVAHEVLADLAIAARSTEDVAPELKRLAKQADGGNKRLRRKLAAAWTAFRKVEPFW